MRNGKKQVWARIPKRSQSLSFLPFPALSHASLWSAHAEPGGQLLSLSLRQPPRRPASDTQTSTKSRFRVTCPLFSSFPRAGGGCPEEGRPGSGVPGLDSARLPPGDVDRRGIPALPRPPTAWPAAAQSPGRWAPAAPDTGSLARSLTHHSDRGHHGGSGGGSG